MNSEWTILGETGLQFFGKMSAANAHEIKNALAVINENAGLLEDLVAMTEKGMPLEPERLKRLAGKIKQQVARADDIAKSTNRFAHSVDKAHGPANLGQSLELVKTMAMRFATQRHITIEIAAHKSAITLPASPFTLLHLLWLCLQQAMTCTEADHTLRVQMEKNKTGTRIRYGPLKTIEHSRIAEFNACREMSTLLQTLRARISANADADELLLTFSSIA